MIRFVIVNVGISSFLYLAGLFVSYNPTWIFYNEVTRFSVVFAWFMNTTMQWGLWDDINNSIWGEKK